MKTFLSGLVALALMPLSIGAYAADMPLPTKAPPAAVPVATDFPPPASWTGFYLGINGGIADENGVLVGGTLGYNYQSGPLVVGIEGDLDPTWANYNAPYLDTARGRIGYAIGPVLPYVTAGWAWTGGGGTGAALGGGVEFQLNQALSAKIEYLHTDANGPVDIVRAGLNVHFNSFALPGMPIAARY